jgi:hypothetical protein
LRFVKQALPGGIYALPNVRAAHKKATKTVHLKEPNAIP